MKELQDLGAVLIQRPTQEASLLTVAQALNEEIKATLSAQEGHTLKEIMCEIRGYKEE